MSKHPVFKVEMTQSPCEHCEAGGNWTVVWTDSLGFEHELGTSFGDEEHATDIAGWMNDAYEEAGERAEAEIKSLRIAAVNADHELAVAREAVKEARRELEDALRALGRRV